MTDYDLPAATPRNEDGLIDCRGFHIPAIEKLFAYLKESEADAIALIDYIHNKSNPPEIPLGGEIELGFVLYWIHHPPQELQDVLNKHPVLKGAFTCLQQMAPPTGVTTNQYNQLLADVDQYGEPWVDGTMIGPALYQQLDPLWAIAAINYAFNLIDPDGIDGLDGVVPFPKPPASPPGAPVRIPLTSRKGPGNDPVIAIVGDWGTGYYTEPGTDDTPCPAKRVMTQISAINPKPDYLVHLGDVYYAGTGDLRFPPFEEQLNFIDLWPDQGTGRSFTLNSNHEMYGGGIGYFRHALNSPMFSAQKGMSYFALNYGKWLILGLDSAYYSDEGNATKSHPYNFYMAGAIGSAKSKQQINWINQFKNHNGPVMVMTHHTGCNLTGSNANLLYYQVQSALGRQPALWYWGHLHNGIVYKTLDDKQTKGRCCGHGSIPFGNGWGLEEANRNKPGSIPYYAHTPDTRLPDTSGQNPKNPRVKNGFATVTLRGDGGFTEAFYEVDSPQPVWQASWTASQVGPTGPGG